MLVLAEIDSNVIFDNNRQIELGLPITVQVKIVQAMFTTTNELNLKLEVLDSVVALNDSDDLDVHDKNAYKESLFQ